jgi:hypothetical protein
MLHACRRAAGAAHVGDFVWSPPRIHSRVRGLASLHRESTHRTSRRFCRAKMTHLGQGRPAICKARRNPRRGSRRRSLRFPGGNPDRSRNSFDADLCLVDSIRRRHDPQWRRSLSHLIDGLRSGPRAVRRPDPASRTPRRRIKTGFRASHPQNRLSKFAQDARSGAREGCRTARGAQNAFRANFARPPSSPVFRHRGHAPSDTRRRPHPAGGGDSHAPPAFSTDLHSL